jgi:signal transduction histidine kinase/DNA-binding NarL/FixJ family response regulator
MGSIMTLGATVALTIGVFVYSISNLHRAEDRSKIADSILQRVMELGLLTHEYESRGENRPKQQWVTSHRDLTARLDDLKALTLNAESASLESKMRKNADLLVPMFRRLIMVQPVNVSLLQGASPARMFSERILLRLSAMTADAHRLSEIKNEDLDSAINGMVIALMLCFAVVAASIAIIFSANRRMITSLRALSGAAEEIGEGTAQVSARLPGHDEFSALSDVLRDMTERLARSHDKLAVANGHMSLEIAERRQAQVALVQSREEAMRAGQAKADFLSNMSHEIRTPLNAIIGFSDALAETTLDAGQQEMLRHMHDSGRMLLAIVNDILDFSKIETGNLRIESTHFSIPKVVETARSSVISAAGKKNIEVHLRLDPDVPAVAVGDPTRLGQVMLNLLSNAVKFTAAGHVTIAVSVGLGSGGDRIVRFDVEDTGIGIPPERMDDLFKQFSQLDPSISRKYGGTGLGLAIARRLVELMGGRIEVSSKVGAGSTFSVTLPLLEAVPGATEPDLPEKAAARSAPTFRSGLRILVAEDVEMNQQLVKNILGKYGCEIMCVSTGREAIAAVEKDDYDLLLMDIQMPEMGGIEAARNIRTMRAPKSLIPIIALTAHAEPTEVNKFLAAGMDGHLTKPFRKHELLEAIEVAVRAGSIEASSTSNRERAAQPILDHSIVQSLRSAVGDEKADELFYAIAAEIRIRATQLRDQTDIAKLANEAHSLISLSGNIGLMDLCESCRSLEQAARKQQEKQIGPAKDRVLSAVGVGLSSVQVLLLSRRSA